MKNTTEVHLVMHPLCFHLLVYRPQCEFRNIYIKKPKFWEREIFKNYNDGGVNDNLKHRAVQNSANTVVGIVVFFCKLLEAKFRNSHATSHDILRTSLAFLVRGQHTFKNNYFAI